MGQARLVDIAPYLQTEQEAREMAQKLRACTAFQRTRVQDTAPGDLTSTLVSMGTCTQVYRHRHTDMRTRTHTPNLKKKKNLK